MESEDVTLADFMHEMIGIMNSLQYIIVNCFSVGEAREYFDRLYEFCTLEDSKRISRLERSDQDLLDMKVAICLIM